MSIPESELSYGSILTLTGENAEINGKLNNKPINFTHIAIGDANDVYVQPSRTQTTLVNEITRIPVTGMEKITPSGPDGVPQLKVWAKIPDDIVDIAVREFAAVATFDGDSYLHAVGNSVRIPILSGNNNGGEVNDIFIEMTFSVTSLEPIVMIDPAIVTATRQYVDRKDNEHEQAPNPHPQYFKKEGSQNTGIIGNTAINVLSHNSKTSEPNSYILVKTQIPASASMSMLNIYGGFGGQTEPFYACLAWYFFQNAIYKPYAFITNAGARSVNIKVGVINSRFAVAITAGYDMYLNIDVRRGDNNLDANCFKNWTSEIVEASTLSSFVDVKAIKSYNPVNKPTAAEIGAIDINDFVGLALPDSTVVPMRNFAFLGDGSSYQVADYPKLMSKVKGTPIMVAQALIDANPTHYAANYGISADGLQFTVPNYPLMPHLAAAGHFGAVGTTVEDHIQNITAHISAPNEGLMLENTPTVSGAFSITNQFSASSGDVSGSNTSWQDLDFDASRVARTGLYTEVNSSFLNYYIIHGESA